MELVVTNTKEAIPLVGTVIIGRNQPALPGLEDVRYSRTQLTFRPTLNGYEVVHHGPNPAWFSSQGQPFVRMLQDAAVQLQQGDRCKVMAIGPELTFGSAHPAPPSVPLDDVTMSSAANDSVVVPPSPKRQKTFAGGGECYYGAACINQSQRHRRLLEHPAQSGIAEAEEDAALPAGGLLSDLPDSEQHAHLPCLAFPSISTGAFQFDYAQAAQVLVGSVYSFLSTNEGCQLMLVDLKESSFLQRVKSLWNKKVQVGSRIFARFQCAVCDLTKVNSSAPDGRVKASMVVNSANVNLSQRGSGLNLALHRACKELGEETQKQYRPPAQVGVPLPVRIPEYSAWGLREGISCVIHVLGPNMNRSRPNCLNNDYAAGCQQLKNTYDSLFKFFAMAAAPSSNSPGLAAPQQQQLQASQAGDVFGGSDTKLWSKSWIDGLFKYCFHPDKHPDRVLEYDERTVVVRDKYPKSLHHYLVMPRSVGVPRLSDLQFEEHFELLKAMRDKGLEIAARYPQCQFRLGFHAVPSMRQLHMHLISQDFQGQYLKNKKHWNSYNTPFFIPCDTMLAMFEKTRAVKFDEAQAERLLKNDLRCHRCSEKMRNMPLLKQHIGECKHALAHL